MNKKDILKRLKESLAQKSVDELKENLKLNQLMYTYSIGEKGKTTIFTNVEVEEPIEKYRSYISRLLQLSKLGLGNLTMQEERCNFEIKESFCNMAYTYGKMKGYENANEFFGDKKERSVQEGDFPIWLKKAV